MNNQRNFSVYESLKFGLSGTFENFGIFFGAFLIKAACWLTLIVTFLVMLFSYNILISSSQDKPLSQELVGKTVVINGKVAKPEQLQVHFAPTNFTPALAVIFSLLIFLAMLFGSFINAGVTKLTLDIYDQGRGSFSTLFSQGKNLPSWILLNLLYLALMTVFFTGINILQVLIRSLVRVHISLQFSLAFIIIVILSFVLAYLLIRLSFARQIIIDKEVGPIAALGHSYAITQRQLGKILSLATVCYILSWLSASFIPLMIVIWPLTSLAYIFVYRKIG